MPKKYLPVILVAVVVLVAAVMMFNTPSKMEDATSPNSELPVNSNPSDEMISDPILEPGDEENQASVDEVNDLPESNVANTDDSAVSGPADSGAIEPAPGATPEESLALRQVSNGQFSSRNNYTVTGTASVVTENNQTKVLFNNFSSTDGPDLKVWLTVDGDIVDLGDIQGLEGDFTYNVPQSVDPDSISAVTIRCRAFFRDFGVAELN